MRGVWLTTLLFSGEAFRPRAAYTRYLTSGTSGDLRRHVDSGDAVCLSFQTGSFGDGFVTSGGPVVLLKLTFVPGSAKLNPFDSGSESLTILVYHRFSVVQHCKVSAKTARLKVKQIPE